MRLTRMFSGLRINRIEHTHGFLSNLLLGCHALKCYIKRHMQRLFPLYHSLDVFHTTIEHHVMDHVQETGRTHM